MHADPDLAKRKWDDQLHACGASVGLVPVNVLGSSPSLT
jgi:hypothetical protein